MTERVQLKDVLYFEAHGARVVRGPSGGTGVKRLGRICGVFGALFGVWSGGGVVARAAPVAEVSWVSKGVRIRSPEGGAWQDGVVGSALLRFHQVRTGKGAASELILQGGGKLALGARASVVLYGPKKRTRRDPRAWEVILENSELVVRGQGEPVDVTTMAARVRTRSRTTRVHHRARTKVTTVSVHDGVAVVSALGATVTVSAGFGTRVRDGQTPEPPWPLVAPPRWAGEGAITAMDGRPVVLRWLQETTTSTTRVELFALDDHRAVRRLRAWRVRASRMRFRAPPAGAYRVRLSAVDGRGIVGRPGPLRTLLVLPRPSLAGGRVWARFDGQNIHPFPGVADFPSVAGVKLEWDPLVPTDGSGRVVLTEPKTYRLPFVMTTEAGSTTEPGAIVVEVAPITIELEGVGPPAVKADRVHTPVRFRLGDFNQDPLSGRKITVALHRGHPAFALGRPQADGRLSVRGSLKPALGIQKHDGFLATDLGEGHYGVILTHPRHASQAPARLSSTTHPPRRRRGAAVLRVVDQVSNTEQFVELRLDDLQVEASGEQDASQLFVAGFLGASMRSGDARASAAVEAGAGNRVGDRARVLVSGRLGYARSSLKRGGAAHPLNRIPFLVRLHFEWLLGAIRPFVGGGVGLSWLAFREEAPGLAFEGQHLSWSGSVGVALAMGEGEFVLEGAYEGVRARVSEGPESRDFQIPLHHVGFLLGYRWHP